MAGGYANRLIPLKFPELSEDPDNDPIWVSIRNPKLMPPGELQPRDVPTGADGQPDPDEANAAMYEIFAKLIVAWRVYDATDFQVDPTTGTALPQAVLGSPATPDLVRKLPTAIINAVAEQMSEAANPR